MIQGETIILGRQVSWYGEPPPPPRVVLHLSPNAAAVRSLTSPPGKKMSVLCSLLSAGTCRWNGGLGSAVLLWQVGFPFLFSFFFQHWQLWLSKTEPWSFEPAATKNTSFCFLLRLWILMKALCSERKRLLDKTINYYNSTFKGLFQQFWCY